MRTMSTGCGDTAMALPEANVSKAIQMLRRMRAEFFANTDPLLAEESYRLLYLLCSDRSTYVPTLQVLLELEHDAASPGFR